jgi:branched-chain amino acid transport system substrate-binding protein
MRLSPLYPAALAAVIAVSPAFAAGDPIKIGVSGPYTGGSASMGVSMRDGVKLAIDEINKAGGVLGRPLLAVERDDEAKNEVGVQVAQELINKEHVAATVGFINTGVALASQRFYEEAEIPVIDNVATGTVVTKQFMPPDFDHNYVFRNAANDSIQSAMIAAQAIGKNHFKAPAILADSTNYGTLGRQDLETALAKLGVKPVAEEKFNIGDVDMTAQLLKAKSAGADCVLTYAIGPELAQIANGMAKLGWKVPIIGSWTLSMASFIDNAGANGNGAEMPETFIQEGTTPKRAAFIAAYKAAYKTDRMPSPVSAAQGYDSIFLLAAAIRQAGTTDGPKIRAALEDLKDKVDGVVTTYDRPFSPTDHEAITANIPVFGLVKDGRVVYWSPEDQAEAGTVRTKQTVAN